MGRFCHLLSDQRRFLLKEADDSAAADYENRLYKINADDYNYDADPDGQMTELTHSRMLVRKSDELNKLSDALMNFHKTYIDLISKYFYDNTHPKLQKLVKRIYYGYMKIDKNIDMIEEND